MFRRRLPHRHSAFFLVDFCSYARPLSVLLNTGCCEATCRNNMSRHWSFLRGCHTVERDHVTDVSQWRSFSKSPLPCLVVFTRGTVVFVFFLCSLFFSSVSFFVCFIFCFCFSLFVLLLCTVALDSPEGVANTRQETGNKEA